jgi:hypothetical protein
LLSNRRDFEFVTRHQIVVDPDFLFEIDEYKRGDEQFLLAHIRVDKLTPSVLKRMDSIWRTFRSVIKAPLFAVSETDDGKWERFVARYDFKPFMDEVICNNGVPRRLFISIARDHP